MTSKNVLRVQKFRDLKGNITFKEKYNILRKKYEISSKQSNIMKFWSVERILKYFSDNDIKPSKKLKAVDRL